MGDESIYLIVFAILIGLAAFSIGFFFGIEYGINQASKLIP
jgi:hypothetical protein